MSYHKISAGKTSYSDQERKDRSYFLIKFNSFWLRQVNLFLLDFSQLKFDAKNPASLYFSFITLLYYIIIVLYYF